MAVYTTIDDPSAHFQTTLYTGTGSELAITNGGNSDLQPDMVWTKSRSNTLNHNLYDSNRGVNKMLKPNLTVEEGTDAQSLKSFNSDGFTVGTDTHINTSGATFVSWQWKANGGTTSSNTSGSITSTVQANTTAGFSIVTYAGQDSAGTVGHGLGAEPHAIIIKNRTGSYSWHCYWKVLGNQGLNWLESTAGASSSSGTWNTTTPTSTLFSMDGGSSFSGTNRASNNFVAYCFTSIQGYSKFGSYIGNGNADGPFIYTGFKPKYFLLKNVTITAGSGGQHWQISDTGRHPENPLDLTILAETTGGDGSPWSIKDFMANGVKIRGNNFAMNTSGDRYIYIAFAEHPFVTSTAIPCTAG